MKATTGVYEPMYVIMEARDLSSRIGFIKAAFTGKIRTDMRPFIERIVHEVRTESYHNGFIDGANATGVQAEELLAEAKCCKGGK